MGFWSTENPHYLMITELHPAGRRTADARAPVAVQCLALHDHRMDAEAPLTPQETAEILVTLIVVGGEALPLDVVLDLRQRLIEIGSLPVDAPLGDVYGVVDRLVHEAQLRRWTVVIRSSRDPQRRRSPALGAEAHAAIQRGGWHLGAQWS